MDLSTYFTLLLFQSQLHQSCKGTQIVYGWLFHASPLGIDRWKYQRTSRRHQLQHLCMFVRERKRQRWRSEKRNEHLVWLWLKSYRVSAYVQGHVLHVLTSQDSMPDSILVKEHVLEDLEVKKGRGEQRRASPLSVLTTQFFAESEPFCVLDYALQRTHAEHECRHETTCECLSITHHVQHVHVPTFPVTWAPPAGYLTNCGSWVLTYSLTLSLHTQPTTTTTTSPPINTLLLTWAV